MKPSLINYSFCVWVFAVLSMAFVACSKDEDDNDAGDAITVTISGLSELADSVYLKDHRGEYLARAGVKDDRFSIKFPTPTNLYPAEGLYPQGVTISAPFKFCIPQIEAFKDGGLVGYIEYGNTAKDNEVYVDLMYVDRDATVTGSGINGGYTISFNTNLKKGWNYVAYFEKGQDGDGKDIYEETTTLPGGLKWYFLNY